MEDKSSVPMRSATAQPGPPIYASSPSPTPTSYAPDHSPSPSSTERPLLTPALRLRPPFFETFDPDPALLAAFWLTAFVILYLILRGFAMAGVPADGVSTFDPVDAFDDILKILTMGFCLCYLTDLLVWKRTYRLIFNFRSRKFPFSGPVLAFTFTGLAFAGISNIPGLQHSLADFSTWTTPMLAIVPILLLALLSVVILIAVRTFRAKRHMRTQLYLFFSFRIGLLLFFILSGYGMYADNIATAPHLHHFFLAFYIAIWCDSSAGFLSDVVLMGAASIWIQGLAAYSYANFITALNSQPGLCLATDEPVRGVSCTFAASTANFTGSFCFDHHLDPTFAFNCTTLSVKQSKRFVQELLMQNQMLNATNSGAA